MKRLTNYQCLVGCVVDSCNVEEFVTPFTKEKLYGGEAISKLASYEDIGTLEELTQLQMKLKEKQQQFAYECGVVEQLQKDNQTLRRALEIQEEKIASTIETYENETACDDDCDKCHLQELCWLSKHDVIKQAECKIGSVADEM